MTDSTQGTHDSRHGRVVTFYSYKGGTGRTMTLANAAWILAASGKRVLAVDWDLEAPGLSRFFHPFLDQDALATGGGVVDMINNYLERAYDGPTPELAEESGHAAVSSHAVSLDWDHFPEGGGIDFISAGRQNEDYSTILNGLNWDQFYQEFEGGTFLDALREQMRHGYDYTLIDSRTGLSDSSKICTQHLPDDLVVCFTLSDQSIDGAAGVARHIDSRFGDRNIRILPVPMRVDEGEKERADRGRAVARRRFRGLPREFSTVRPTEYWGAVEIPYRAFYAYEEVLATFGDEPGVPSTVLGACERLVGELTRGDVSRLPAMPAELREATAARFARRAVNGQVDSVFRLWYAIEDRMWADWVAYVLESAGYPVAASRIDGGPATPDEAAEPVSGDAGQELVSMPLLTRHFARTARAEEFWGPLPAGEPAGRRPRTLGLRLGAVQPGAPTGHSTPLDLSSPSLNAVRAAEQLVRHVGGDDEAVQQVTAALADADAPRYPGLRTLIVNLPSRNADFTGRAEELGRLRNRLTGRSGSPADGGAQALHGLGGVGKSQLALEYAYRYLPDYDVVWWVPAQRPGSITTELAELARVLDLRGSLSDTDASAAVRNALTEGVPHRRWLLVFDNAEDPATLREFLPGGEGHVIITSRNQVWNRDATELEVDVFTPEESVAHLRRRLPGLDAAQARRLAEALGDLPLAVEHAAAYLLLTGMSVATYLDLLDTYPSDMFGEAPETDYPLPIMTTFAASLDRLEAEWPAARRLLQMSVFLGPEAFSQALVFKSPEMFRALSAHDPRSRPPVQLLGGLVHAVRRLSLAKVDAQQDTIQVHRLLQSLLRMQLTEAERDEIRGEVQGVLAGQRPLGGEVEDPVNRAAFERIRPHLAACSAESSDRPEVRQLMIDLVRLQWRSGDFELGRAEADRIDALWSGTLGEDHEQTLALRCMRANLQRDLGEYQQSLELSRRTWERQCALFGEGDPGTLVTARGMAAGMRALGMYREALERDQKTYESLLGQFIEEDGEVLKLSHNLAIDYRLLGDSRSAQKFDERTERTHRLALGPAHSGTLRSQLYLARDKRDNGEIREAAVDLERLLGTYRASQGDDHPETLRAAKSFAVSLRVLGEYERAAELTRDTYARYVRRYGENHHDTWTCGLNLAADDWTVGNHKEALRRAEEVWEHFIRDLGELHPNTLGCSDNVAVYLRSPGASPQALRRAADLGEEATGQLTRQLGEEHPFTLCAEVNWAAARAELGDLAAAERSERSCLSRLVEVQSASHPDALACQSNLAVTLKALGRADEAQHLHDDAVRAFSRDRNFGGSHPETLRAEGWERISHVLELHSW